MFGNEPASSGKCHLGFVRCALKAESSGSAKPCKSVLPVSLYCSIEGNHSIEQDYLIVTTHTIAVILRLQQM